MTTTLICDCNQTMPLNAKALGEALHEDLTLHSTLCRRDAGAFQKAIQSGQDVVCLLYTSPSPRDVEESRMPSSA